MLSFEDFHGVGLCLVIAWLLQGKLCKVPISIFFFSIGWAGIPVCVLQKEGNAACPALMAPWLQEEVRVGRNVVVPWPNGQHIQKSSILQCSQGCTDARKAVCASLMCPAADRLLEMNFYLYLYKKTHFFASHFRKLMEGLVGPRCLTLDRCEMVSPRLWYHCHSAILAFGWYFCLEEGVWLCQSLWMAGQWAGGELIWAH